MINILGESYDFYPSFNRQYGSHPCHLLSIPKDDLGGWPSICFGSCFLTGNCKWDRPTHSGLSHLSFDSIDPRALLTHHQWIDALVGVSLGEGISCQRIMGSGVRINLHQPRELDIDQVFAFKIIILCKNPDSL
jgi:hypothetical protein